MQVLGRQAVPAVLGWDPDADSVQGRQAVPAVLGWDLVLGMGKDMVRDRLEVPVELD